MNPIIPIVLARKPLSEPTVAANVLRWGTGAINVDGCRVEGEPIGERCNNVSMGSASGGIYGKAGGFVSQGHTLGRWPANVVHDGSEEVVCKFPESGPARSGGVAGWQKNGYVGGQYEPIDRTGYDDNGGSAARFFKACPTSKKEREELLIGHGRRRLVNAITDDNRKVPKVVKLPNTWKILDGDCLKLLKTLPGNCIDAVCTDPPYHLTSIVKRFGKEGSAPAKSFGKSNMHDKTFVNPNALQYVRLTKGFMGQCYHPATDVMTTGGWKPISEVSISDKVATLNPISRKLEWQKVLQTHSSFFSGDMVHVKHRSAEQLVTPNHQIVTIQKKSIVLTEPLETPRAFHLLSQAEPKNGMTGDVTIESERRFGRRRQIICETETYKAKPFFRMLGLWLGDGFVVSRRHDDHPANDFFGFAVKKARKIKVIKQVLAALGIRFTETEGDDKTTFYCYNFVLLEFLRKLGKAKAKHIPTWIFDRDASDLEEIYQGMIDTDGSRQGDNSQEVYYTASRQLAGDFQRLCLHTGRSAISIFKPGGYENSIEGRSFLSADSWALSVLKQGKLLYGENNNRVGGKHNKGGNVIYRFPYEGDVYCIGVQEHHIIYTRFNGKPVWSGNSWDGGDIAFQVELWKQVYRVMKPGAYLVAFGGTRTYHRMVCAIEDAGFDVRDQLAWIYGSGFPKSQNVSKHIDKMNGAERKVICERYTVKKFKPGATVVAEGGWGKQDIKYTATDSEPASEESAQWDGYGTALKPSQEPVVLARKPLSEKTVAANVLRWGTGAINVDGCRIGDFVNETPSGTDRYNQANFEQGYRPSAYPTNGKDELLPRRGATVYGKFAGVTPPTLTNTGTYGFNDSGSAARFFYTAKASTQERKEGLVDKNNHPTVKPVSLMRWLVRLITPPNGLVLDPFTGSGSTGIATRLEDKRFIGMELEKKYADIARGRITKNRLYAIEQSVRTKRTKLRLSGGSLFSMDEHSDGDD